MREHGTRTKYMHDGCRCFPCRLANADYESSRMRDRRAGECYQVRYSPVVRHYVVRHKDTGEIVLRTPDRDAAYAERDRLNRESGAPITPWATPIEVLNVRKHLRRLQESGVGINTIAKAVPMSRTRLQEIYHNRGARPDRPDRRKLRRETAERILKVWPDPPGAALVDAGETWRLLNELLAAGYPKAHVAQALGKKMPALQIQKQCVLARTERAVQALHDETWRLSPALRAVCRCPEWQPEQGKGKR
ncbi:MAG: hypothetical protein A2W00_04590 [Candidatus Eisenbacteria bacterium RBG_16_71_46]|nr:MAG: hypothetical protein A2W00_04590 [Candidatus Eisenbacteria bacterium RBG_16_71_46]